MAPSKNRRKWVWIMAGLLLFLGILFLFANPMKKKDSKFTGKEKSIAVLPFINLDTARDTDYFSDGMMDEIINRISAISGLRVISRNGVLGYKGSKLTAAQIAAQLHVAAILTGKTKKSGQEYQFHAELIDAGSGESLWSEDFSRNINDVFSFQNEIAREVARQLDTELTGNDLNKISSRPTKNLEAYDQYLKGIYQWNKRDAGSLRTGIGYFNQAIKLDSNYARAWSGIADCYSALGYGSHDAPSFDFLQAEAAARRAISLDSSLAEPHTSLGYIYFYYYWDWEKAKKEFLQAIRLNPEYPLAHDSYVYYLTAREQFAEAAVEMEKAYSLDPMSAFILTDRGFTLFYTGNYDRAANALKEVFTFYPKFPLAHLWLGRCYQEKKMYSECIAEYELARTKDKDWPVALAAKGFTYGISNQKEEAKKVLAQMLDLMNHRYVTPYSIALVYAGMNDMDKTFEWLNKAYAQRTNWLVWLKLDPRWNVIRKDYRYLPLVRKIGLDRQLPPVKMD